MHDHPDHMTTTGGTANGGAPNLPRDHNAHSHDHLHSHVHGPGEADRAGEIGVLAASFVDGFRQAEDKTSYLRVAAVPFKRKGTDGLTLNLVDVAINANWQVGTASPAFGSKELAYMPFPGEMVRGRETMIFTYVSLTERVDYDLRDFLADKLAQDPQS
ncbi:MAG: hypothetical protein AAGE61_20755 [Pseudomonadota bacterium]